MQLILVDSTALLRLLLGEPGAEFVASLFTRAERGLENIAIVTDALREALEAGVYAAASSMLGTSDQSLLVEKLRTTDIRAKAYEKLRPLIDYMLQLHMTGRIQFYTPSIQDIAAAYHIALEKQIPLRDALTIHMAAKVGAQRIASFSRAVHQHAPRGIAVIPSL